MSYSVCVTCGYRPGRRFACRLYFNGHHWLARRLAKANIDFEMIDNAFVRIANPHQAQGLADSLDARQLHRRLDRWAKRLLPLRA